MLWSGVSAGVLLVLFLVVGLPFGVPFGEQWSFAFDGPLAVPEALWTPVQTVDLARCWFLALALFSAGLFLGSAGELVEDREVRHAHEDPVYRITGVIHNPACNILYLWGGGFIITSVVLAIRYVYLMVV